VAQRRGELTLHAADLEYSDYDDLPVGWPHEQGVQSLGYAVLAWAETYLAQPDGDMAGNPWRWRESQARFVAWWYAVDENGEFLFNHGQIVLSKGSGKSPMATVLSCCELGGPVLFSHFDENGDAIGRPHPSPWIALAAVSHEQTGNMSELLSSALNEGIAREAIPGLDPGIMRVRSDNGYIFRVAAADRSIEGQRTTAAFLDESQHWVASAKGDKLSRAIRRNLMKTGGRAIELTNCWMPGEDSVAEKTYTTATSLADRSVAGKRAAKRILRWHPKIHVEDLSDTSELRSALDRLYADFPWVDVQRFMDEAEQDMSASEIRRFFLNEITSADDALITATEWDACLVPEAEWRPLRPGDTITLGFDGGKTDDSTVLMACRVEDRSFHVLGMWEKPRDYRPKGSERWQVPREAVDAAVQDARDTYDVAGFYADVALWESYVDKWSAELIDTVSVRAAGHSVVGWDMRGRQQALTRGVENFVGAVLDARIQQNGDSRLRRHILNTRRRHNSYGLSFGKESRESPKKIDAFAATLLADMARTDFEMSGKSRQKRSKVIVY
jgi:phage terminase large subunit-like protein